VTGRLIRDEWEAKDGTKRTKHQVIGNVTFGSGGDQVAAGEPSSDG